MNRVFSVNNVDIPYEISVNKRLKYMRISMGVEGMKVSVPRKADLAEVERLLNSKAKWIYDHYIRFQSIKLPRRDWDSGEELLYMGERYRVVVNPWDKRTVKASFDGEQFKVFVSRELQGHKREDPIEEALKGLYKSIAHRIVNERIEYHSKIIGVSYNDVKIKEQKTRWGSCSARRNLNFNWKIIMAPRWVLDYVIIHELCHLKYLNHSEEYWRMVGSYMPDYKSAREWLKENGMRLTI